MKKISNQEILEIVEREKTIDVDKLEKFISLSKSNLFYRIRQLKQKGLISELGTVNLNPVINYQQGKEKIQNMKAINQDENNNIIEILHTEIDENNLIPSSDANYQKREIDNTLSRYVSRNKNIILIGNSGSGKTTMVSQLASELNLPFLRVSLDDTSCLREFIGRREIVNGTTFFRTGLLLEMIQKKCIILIDEFNALPASKLFFLHELLDNRQLFVKDANGGMVINVNPECKIILACNPNNRLYGGTNKINCALANRMEVTLSVPDFKLEDLNSIFDTGNEKITSSLKSFYQDALRIIKEQNLRVVLSLRNVITIVESIKLGDNPLDAVKFGFYNNALLTASDREKDALEQLARVHFGTETVKTEGANNNE